MLNPEDYIFIGILGKPVGMKGEIFVTPLTSFPERLLLLEELFLTKRGMVPKKIKVKKIRSLKNGSEDDFEGISEKDKIIFSLEGIDHISKAEELSGYKITIPKSERYELPEGYYYIDDLTGCEVVTVDGETIGKIKDVWEQPSSDIYVVDYKGKDALIPVVDEFVKDIDIENKKITVKLIDGLLPDDEN